MENQNPKKEVYSALVKATNELKNPTNSTINPYYQSKYVPLADIIDIAKPVLGKYKLAVLQTPYVMYEVMQQTGKNGQIYNKEIAVVKVSTMLIHENGESIDFPPMVLKASGNTPQAIRSAITYGRRYSIASILGIAGKEEDDDGNGASVNGQPNNNYQQPNQQPSGQQANQPQQNTKANSNVDLSEVEAVVTKKSEHKSGKGNPYVELVLEKDGKYLTAIAKDDNVLKVAKDVEEGAKGTFKILSQQGFHFVKGIEIQGAKAE